MRKITQALYTPPIVQIFSFIGLLFIGCFVALLLAEMTLRTIGWTYLNLQRRVWKDRDNNTYRILALGESTTAGIKDSWPAILETMLNSEMRGKKFNVYNEGIAGTNTAFIISRLEENLDRYRPQMVITMMGLNDQNLRFEKTTFSWGLHDVDLSSLRLVKLFQQAKEGIRTATLIAISRWERRAYRYASSDTAVFVHAAELFGNAGRFDKSEAMYRVAKTREPDNEAIDGALGRMLYLEGNYSAAAEVLTALLGRNPHNRDALRVLGDIASKNGEFERAATLLTRAANSFPENPDVWYESAYALFRAGHFEAAASAVRHVLYLNPKYDIALTLLRGIYGRLGTAESVLRTYGVSVTTQTLSQGKALTEYHYQTLFTALKRRNIAYVAMEYPTLDVDDLKKYFSSVTGNQDIMFVSNRENFAEALRTGRYEDYFVDSFAGTFGHATRKGNTLIARAVADQVFPYLQRTMAPTR